MSVSHRRDRLVSIARPIAAVSEDIPVEVKAAPALAGITPRAFLIGLLLIPLLCYWVEYTEVVTQGTDLAAMSLVIGAVFALFVLICLNAVIGRFAPRWRFTQAELLYIYLMQTVSIGISGIGMYQFLITGMGNALHYANSANGWKDLFGRYIPRHLVPDPAVLDKFYTGNSHLSLEFLAGWATPIFWWSGFTCVLLGSMLCLNVILRRQWMDSEKLPFPIVYLPLELTRHDPENGPIWRNRLFWMAFLIVGVLESLASLNYLNPSIPALPMKPSTTVDLGTFFTTPPWNAIGYLPLAFYPLVLGLVFFLPVEVSFSAWFFYLFAKFQDVICVASGLKQPGVPPALARMPYHGEQGAGAFIGLALYGLWTSRSYLAGVFGKAFGEKAHRDVPDDNEPVPYRFAVFGFIIGFSLLCLFCMFGGMAWWLAIAFFALYFLFAITFTRIRAEAGLPWGYGPYVNPHSLLTDVAGKKHYDMGSLTMLAYLQWFDMDYRCMNMPYQMEAMKIANSVTNPSRLNNRHLYLAIMSAVLMGIVSSWWALLSIYYHYGAATGNVNSWRTDMGTQPFNLLSDWIKNPTPFSFDRLNGVFAGMGVAVALSLLRTQFLWWPFHPTGYAIAETGAMSWPLVSDPAGMAGETAHSARYGGMKAFRTAMPFAIGLILGDYVISSAWALIGLWLGIPTYRAFPI